MTLKDDGLGILTTQSGFSLTEVMVAAGLAGITALAVGSLTTMTAKTMSTAKAQNEFNAFLNALSQTVQSSQGCNSTIKTPTGGTPVIYTYDGAFNVSVAVGGVNYSGTASSNTQTRFGSLTIKSIKINLADRSKSACPSNSYEYNDIGKCYFCATTDHYDTGNGVCRNSAEQVTPGKFVYYGAALIVTATKPSGATGAPEISNASSPIRVNISFNNVPSSITSSIIEGSMVSCSSVQASDLVSLGVPHCAPTQSLVFDGVSFNCKTTSCPTDQVAAGSDSNGNVLCQSLPTCSPSPIVFPVPYASASPVIQYAAQAPVLKKSTGQYECRTISCPAGTLETRNSDGEITACVQGQNKIAVECTPVEGKFGAASGLTAFLKWACLPPPNAPDSTNYFCTQDCSNMNQFFGGQLKLSPSYLGPYFPLPTSNRTAAECLSSGGTLVDGNTIKDGMLAPATTITSDISFTFSGTTLTSSQPVYCAFPHTDATVGCPSSSWKLYGSYVVPTKCPQMVYEGNYGIPKSPGHPHDANHYHNFHNDFGYGHGEGDDSYYPSCDATDCKLSSGIDTSNQWINSGGFFTTPLNSTNLSKTCSTKAMCEMSGGWEPQGSGSCSCLNYCGAETRCGRSSPQTGGVCGGNCGGCQSKKNYQDCSCSSTIATSATVNATTISYCY